MLRFDKRLQPHADMHKKSLQMTRQAKSPWVHLTPTSAHRCRGWKTSGSSGPIWDARRAGDRLVARHWGPQWTYPARSNRTLARFWAFVLVVELCGFVTLTLSGSTAPSPSDKADLTPDSATSTNTSRGRLTMISGPIERPTPTADANTRVGPSELVAKIDQHSAK